MSEKFTRTYYRIRFPEKADTYGEFYSSRNGTDQWGELSKVKALISRGRPHGYNGLIPFENYEILKFTETVEIEQEVVELTGSSK